mmetsp:Transcript_2428/g.3471  ORF Transcript_2428/g.3471 Transcript_2428/m.3471 type:complete len:233 (-) Transcript_2428:28-726(-)
MSPLSSGTSLRGGVDGEISLFFTLSPVFVFLLTLLELVLLDVTLKKFSIEPLFSEDSILSTFLDKVVFVSSFSQSSSSSVTGSLKISFLAEILSFLLLLPQSGDTVTVVGFEKKCFVRFVSTLLLSALFVGLIASESSSFLLSSSIFSPSLLLLLLLVPTFFPSCLLLLSSSSSSTIAFPELVLPVPLSVEVKSTDSAKSISESESQPLSFACSVRSFLRRRVPVLVDEAPC